MTLTEIIFFLIFSAIGFGMAGWVDPRDTFLYDVVCLVIGVLLGCLVVTFIWG